jgi:hypothetical protein
VVYSKRKSIAVGAEDEEQRASGARV